MLDMRSNDEQHGQPQADPTWFNSFGRFRMSEDGLFSLELNGRADAETDTRKRVSAPFEVVGRAQSPDGTGWGREIRFCDEDGVTRTFFVADAILQADPRQLAAQLADLGLRIERGRAGDLADYLNQSDPPGRITRVSQTGWHVVQGAICFALPDAAFGAPPSEIVIVDGDGGSFAVRGTLDDWKKGVGTLVQGHSRGVFMISASLAAPLLSPIGQEGGGFNFFGASSSGKSTLLHGSGSVWGRGSSDGFVGTWRSTSNGFIVIQNRRYTQ